MSAFTMTSAKAFAAPAVGRPARRGSLTVRAAVAHGKGGEEGGASFNNDAFGMVAKNANYMLFATAVSKVRVVGSTFFSTSRWVDPYSTPIDRSLGLCHISGELIPGTITG
jgi:hypothetical protein|tara:strand:- start:6620 stop:6952 length:333 start_codon:yes stop_codon:yes gene_type:complete